MDLAAEEAMIRTKYATKPVQDLAVAFERIKMKVRENTVMLLNHGCRKQQMQSRDIKMPFSL